VLALHGRLLESRGIDAETRSALYKISTNPALPKPLARDMAYLCRGEDVPEGYKLYLALEQQRDLLRALGQRASVAVLPASAEFIEHGDILRIVPSERAYRVLFRSRAHHNSILLTERCNHYCLMCSQPPREVQDDWLIEETRRLIPMLPTSMRELGFTGGEPTLYGERLLEILSMTERYLPRTAVHILSNGRRFSDFAFTRAYAAVRHHDVMVGIPIYSDDPARHNYVVQAENAFDETILGILNLKRLQQRVEIRVVLHAQTIERLPELARFIARNLLFVDQVALMGLEITGFTRGNLGTLWVDPYDYKDTLEEAVDILSAYGVPVWVYNHPLCVVTDRVRPFCIRSISDWKNEYLPACDGCALRAECGGFFSSAVKYRHSDHITPVRAS
jgi:His-Xaa-Ser system radical SAM maturase HxsC